MKLDVLIGMLQYGYVGCGRLPVALFLAPDDYDALAAECEARGLKAEQRGGVLDPGGVFKVRGQRPVIEIETSAGPVRLLRDSPKESDKP